MKGKLKKTVQSATVNEMQTVHIRIQKEPSLDYGLQQKCKKHLKKVTRSSEFMTSGISNRAAQICGKDT